MTFKVVEGVIPRWDEWDACWFGTYNFSTAELRDPNACDGEWHVVVTLPHEVVEFEGYGVPAFEGDVERIEWEKRRRR